jgi:structural maintenance of chromosome 4
VFQDQIEAKQKELSPWTAKINAKRATIDVATSERDALAKKVAGWKDAVKNAHGDLDQQQETQQAKVRHSSCGSTSHLYCNSVV